MPEKGHHSSRQCLQCTAQLWVVHTHQTTGRGGSYPPYVRGSTKIRYTFKCSNDVFHLFHQLSRSILPKCDWWSLAIRWEIWTEISTDGDTVGREWGRLGKSGFQEQRNISYLLGERNISGVIILWRPKLGTFAQNSGNLVLSLWWLNSKWIGKFIGCRWQLGSFRYEGGRLIGSRLG